MKQIKLILLLIFFSISNVFAENDDDFQKWKTEFKTLALANNISENTFDTVMNDFLALVPKEVIYDDFDPDTTSLISFRHSSPGSDSDHFIETIGPKAAQKILEKFELKIPEYNTQLYSKSLRDFISRWSQWHRQQRGRGRRTQPAGQLRRSDGRPHAAAVAAARRGRRSPG